MKLFGILREPDGEGKLTEINSSGGGGVTSYNNLTDRPCYHDSTPICSMVKQTVEITERENSYGTFFGGITDGFGDIVESTFDSGKGVGYNVNFNAGDKFVITVDGVEYETIREVDGTYGFSFGDTRLNSGMDSPNSDVWPFYIKTGDTGFELWMAEENVGAHEISIQVYKEELKVLEDEFIPDTILRKGVTPSTEVKFGTTLCTIPANTTKSVGWIYGYLDVNADGTYLPPYVCATGEYTDSEGVKHFISVDWNIEEKVFELSGTQRHELDIYFSIPEAIEYDIFVTFVSNYQFRSSM